MSRAGPILLLGANGQLGGRLRSALAPVGRVAALTRREVDLADAGAVRAAVRQARPRVVVNAAAYTAVDRAESEPELARRINALAPRVLAEEAERAGALLVHFSTDYVFDGESRVPYREDDATNPLSVYGATKLEGEKGIAAVGGEHLVLRTSWLYDSRGHNFFLTMFRLAREREELRVVDDQVGGPTWAGGLAGAAAEMVAAWLRDPAVRRSGVYHLAAADWTSWHGFATALLAADPRREEQRCRRVVPIPTREYPTPARRPAFSVLSCDRARDAFGVSLPAWREQLAAATAGLAPSAPAAAGTAGER